MPRSRVRHGGAEQLFTEGMVVIGDGRGWKDKYSHLTTNVGNVRLANRTGNPFDDNVET